MSYSRRGYLALKVETTENTAVTPDVFVPLMSEDIVTEWGATAATPISANRANNLRAIKTAIAPPSGTVNVLIEPKTIGYFLRGVFGAVTSGRYMTVSSVSGDWAVGDTVTGAGAATASLLAISPENDYFLIGAITGTFNDGGALNNGSTGAATLGTVDSTVYGHEYKAPQNSLPTFTVEIGLENEAYRYTGVRFNALNSIAQSDNIITAAIGLTARAEFKMARVTAVTSSGSGSKTITVDQTTGLAASDSVKLYRPGTGFLDFEASSDKIHTINAVSSETAFTVTDLETSTAVGDLIVLAPQTPSYTIDEEFAWIGCSTVKIADNITSAISATAESIEDFELTLTNEIEGRHAATGTNVVNRFPATNFLKGLTGTGSLTKTYTDMELLDRLRNSTSTGVQVQHTGQTIGSTSFSYELDWRVPNAVMQPFNASLSEDDLVNQEIGFDMYDSTTDGYFMSALLVNDVTSY